MTALQVKAKKLILCLAVFYRHDSKASLCVSPCVSRPSLLLFSQWSFAKVEETAPPPAPQASRGAYADASWSSVPSYTPQPDSTCGRDAGHGESTRSGCLGGGGVLD